MDYQGIAENLKNEQVLPHSINVFLVVYRVLSNATNIRLSRQEERDLLVAALLHDIGKSTWPEHWFVTPDYLLEMETEILMKMHPLQGASLLKEAGLPEEIISIVRQHHERPGGVGYPLREEPSYPALLLAACHRPHS
jgi:putative nucleotidyltransferase with HDIG domain